MVLENLPIVKLPWVIKGCNKKITMLLLAFNEIRTMQLADG